MEFLDHKTCVGSALVVTSSTFPKRPYQFIFYFYIFIFKDFVYLFLERGEGREKEKERNIDVREKHRSVASHTHPDQGPNAQPRRVP